VEDAVIGAMEIVAAAFEPGKRLAGVLEGLAEETVLERLMGAKVIVVLGDLEELGFPELGFGLAKPAEGPLGIDEHIDEGALLGGLGGVVAEVLPGESGQFGGIFAADDLGLSINAGFQGILGRDGLAFRGTGAGRFLRVETVGLDLLVGRHKEKSGPVKAVRPIRG
jgi:hypothetical protein